MNMQHTCAALFFEESLDTPPPFLAPATACFGSLRGRLGSAGEAPAPQPKRHHAGLCKAAALLLSPPPPNDRALVCFTTTGESLGPCSSPARAALRGVRTVDTRPSPRRSAVPLM